MNLPSYWRRASFAVSEAADLIGVSEDALRTWLARAPFNDFTGAKIGHRVFLSCQDLYFYMLVRELTRYGVPVRAAMLQASLLANEATECLPIEESLVVRHQSEGVTSFELVGSADVSSIGALVLPLRALAIDLIRRAAFVYAKDAA